MIVFEFTREEIERRSFDGQEIQYRDSCQTPLY